MTDQTPGQSSSGPGLDRPNSNTGSSLNIPGTPRTHDYATGLSPPTLSSQDAIRPSTPPRSAHQQRNRLRAIRPPIPQLLRRPPSIGLRRIDQPWEIPPASAEPAADLDRSDSGRRRSSSAPQRPTFLAPSQEDLSRLRSADLHAPLSSVKEEPRAPISPPPNSTIHITGPEIVLPRRSMSVGRRDGIPVVPVVVEDTSPAAQDLPPEQRKRSFLASFRRRRGSATSRTSQQIAEDEYDHGIVDMLDVIDPEVSTLSTLTNVQNSLFIPDLGGFLNRRPVYTITRRQPDAEDSLENAPTRPDYASTLGRTVSRIMTVEGGPRVEYEIPVEGPPGLHRQRTSASITSALTESHYAVLPHGVSLDGWTEAEKDALNDHVRHLLHSRRAKMRRGLKGFGQYVRRPLGFFVTLYATLITLFGLAWVLFLIGWISVGSKQIYVINVIDYILVALFAIMGDGLAPFRAVDTYHMVFIAHYHQLTWKLRKKKQLPKLQDHNDLPRTLEAETDQDEKGEPKDEFSVLSAEQQAKLDHHAGKFAKSHTFYKPHETETHHAFPLRLLVVIVVLLDFHSMLQISLGACTWGIDYHKRPFALTTVILCCSLTCNITAGILISVGDRRTRKKDVIERMFRQTLTQEAIKEVEKRREREENEEREMALERQKEWLAKKEREERKQKEAERRASKEEERGSSKGLGETLSRLSREWIERPKLDALMEQGATSTTSQPITSRSLPASAGPSTGTSTPLPASTSTSANPNLKVDTSSNTSTPVQSAPVSASQSTSALSSKNVLRKESKSSSRNKLTKPPKG